jgi:hypothetical protein
MVPDVSYNCKMQLQPHQGALRCLLSTRLLLFLIRKTEKPSLSFFLPLVLLSLGVFSLAGSFRCLVLLFGLSARFMILGSFLRGFIFC